MMTLDEAIKLIITKPDTLASVHDIADLLTEDLHVNSALIELIDALEAAFFDRMASKKELPISLLRHSFAASFGIGVKVGILMEKGEFENGNAQ